MQCDMKQASEGKRVAPAQAWSEDCLQEPYSILSLGVLTLPKESGCHNPAPVLATGPCNL